MSNPVQVFLAEISYREKTASSDLRGKQKREMEMWETWKAGGMRPEHLRPLLKSFKPLIHSRSNMYTSRLRDIPPEAIRTEFTNQFVKALQTYDPNRGAALNTHINYQLRKAKRFITTYQNAGRIPETRIYKIRELQDAEKRLDDKLGRAPTMHELADKLKWSPKEVTTLHSEVRKAHITGQFESDPSSFTPSRHKEILRLLPYDLTHEEKAVFEHIYGIGGKSVLGPGAIARKLGLSAPKVSRIKKKIADKYAEYSK